MWLGASVIDLRVLCSRHTWRTLSPQLCLNQCHRAAAQLPCSTFRCSDMTLSPTQPMSERPTTHTCILLKSIWDFELDCMSSYPWLRVAHEPQSRHSWYRGVCEGLTPPTGITAWTLLVPGILLSRMRNKVNLTLLSHGLIVWQLLWLKKKVETFQK